MEDQYFQQFEQFEYIRKDEDVPGKYAMANKFIRMPKSLSAPALKVFILALTKVAWNKINKKDQYGRITATFTIREMIEACGSTSNNFDYYREFIKELIRKSYFTCYEPQERGGYMFQEYLLNPEKTEITIFISPILNQYIEKLGQGNFTVYLQSNTYRMKSRFSITLYWHLFSWMDHSRNRKDPFSKIVKLYTTEDLKDIFDLPDDAYCRANGAFDRATFEKKVIIKAVEEINALSNLRVVWSKHKNGKKVVGYVFEAIRDDVHEVYHEKHGLGWNM